MSDQSMSARLRAERERRNWSVKDMAARLRAAADPDTRARMPTNESLRRMIRSWESGQHEPSEPYPALYAAAFGMTVSALFDRPQVWADDELDALELARRVAASDIGEATLLALELAVDDLATAYHRTPAVVLLDRVRRHLAYVSRLMEGRATLAERKRLVVAGGWLSLLAGTCHIDLLDYPAAAARLRTAAALAGHADHREIAAWCLETEAWQVLTDGDYMRAAILSQAAQDIAPRDSSAYIQATAQESRAWAHIGDGPKSRDALLRLHRLAEPMPVPERPEHHYRYDPLKSQAFTALILAWLKDPAAESCARQVLTTMETPAAGPPRKRRAVSARLDLGLALLASDNLDEAAHHTLDAVTSGLLVPSNFWRATEVITAVERRQVPEAAELRAAYQELGARRTAPPE
ncbi:hypothetical protein ACIBG8_33435 [Nonomuraea sp. NPDC050556]|uniref:hypothetical protein n=1 Tax=Nonomuraea sp. NPDC050556 TaxID=3364369 RepID=UPI0037AE8D87